ncbi:MAG: DUF1722 domain-containing protein [Gammaproteobacteria bacterium]|nr:DUF1722 domain-containing protein [Gammaproteobacteria bacterium]
MRIWDVHPGYLDRQRLLGEHRELHGVVSIVNKDLSGYAVHPETRRWVGCGWALRHRHRLLAQEMSFRGYRDRTPVRLRSSPGHWPSTFIDTPGEQFTLLAAKYRGASAGRIPLPRTSHELWSHHKYSVLARDQAAYRALGRRVGALRGREGFKDLALELTNWLRTPPTAGNLQNALRHMAGHLVAQLDPRCTTTAGRMRALERQAAAEREPYLLTQTALTELSVWR